MKGRLSAFETFLSYSPTQHPSSQLLGLTSRNSLRLEGFEQSLRSEQEIYSRV